jgi:hypothetical protein
MEKMLNIFRTVMYVLALLLAIIAIFLPTQAGIAIGELLIFLCIVLGILFFIKHAIDDPKSVILPIGGLVVLIIVFLIGWSMSVGVDYYDVNDELIAKAGLVKFSGAGLTVGIFVFGLAILSLIVSEVVSFFK